MSTVHHRSCTDPKAPDPHPTTQQQPTKVHYQRQPTPHRDNMNAKAAVEGKRKSASPDISSSRTAYPRRNIDQLHCPSITYLCAIGALPQPINNILAAGQEVTKPCVPCAYKICNFDIALDTDFTKRIPNQRPEQCPRSSSSGASLGGGSYDLDGTMGYRRGMNVLTVGDGDFTFSSAVLVLSLEMEIQRVMMVPTRRGWLLQRVMKTLKRCVGYTPTLTILLNV